MEKEYTGKYIFPPRPLTKSPPSGLKTYERMGFVAQPKMNGSCCVLITDGVTVKAMGRHNNILTRDLISKEDLKKLHRGSGWMVLVGEYMNKSQKDGKGKPFIGFGVHDILVLNGKHLIGSTQEARQQILDSLYAETKPYDEFISEIGKSLYRIHNFYGDFDAVFERMIKIEMYEGFVLKRPDGKLENGLRESNNTGWQLKVRKPTKNYKY